MKYIIKNCDNYTNFDEDWTCRSTIQNRKGCYCCKDITDCLLKQIADLCKAEKDKGFVMSRYGFKVPVSQGYDLACRILKELEIEEVDE